MSQDVSLHTDIDQLFATYRDPLWQFIRARVGRHEDAEDILQEVWYQLSRTQDALTQPKAWLYRVARNQIIDRYRRQSMLWLEDLLGEMSEELADEPVSAPVWSSPPDTPEDALWRSEFWEVLYEALDGLPAAQREVFLRNEWEGSTLREIAEQTDTNLKTVISRKGYAVRQLRKRLADWFDEAMFHD